MPQLEAGTLAPPRRAGESPADRRAHPRIPSSRLPVRRVHIPHREPVSLVDLSSGGALLELPFQMSPESRFAVKLDTAVEQVELPFQLLRCYVAEINGGVKYHAAGAFDNLLNLQSLALRASSAARSLIAALERLQQGVQKTAAQFRHDAAFNEILGGVIAWLRRKESIDLVTLKVKAHLMQTYPSLVILPATATRYDHVSSVQAFGLTFTSPHAFSMHDRRVLKAAAQLIALLEDTRRKMHDEVDELQPQVVRTAADWVAGQPLTPTDVRLPRVDRPTPKPPESRESTWKEIESLIFKAAVF
jgi:hypothetical protein